ncbi:MAG: hypothetical protein HBSIN02_02050 [Bacteroidia bacterium]|nr:MAG: hypothetical protein HBSIN02_02050 [Bacteroidia bacterium]
MRKTILVYGFLSAGIIVVLGFINTKLWKAGTLNFDNGEIFGYAAMVIALSMVFFGIKTFRDKYLGGVIRFGKAFVVGLMITLIASAVYVAAWEVYWQTDDELRGTFMDRYTEHILGKLRAGGATDEQVDQKRREMDEMKKMYDIPVVRLAITLAEILPVGLLVTLISAAILRRKPAL